MSNIFFTSDTHAFHKNITKGVTSWVIEDDATDRTRDFDTEDEMTQSMIESINSIVKPNDILYHMGDWSFGGYDNIAKFRDALNVRTIHLVLGNHDQHIRSNRELSDGRNTQDLFTSVQELIFHKKINGQRITLCHYAMRVWNKSHKGAWQIHGHSHGTLPRQQDSPGIHHRTMDVGVDVAYEMFGEYRPFAFEEVQELFKDAVDTKIDHHHPSNPD